MKTEIIQGDCLAVIKSLPAGCVDCVVSDPPYCSGGFSEAGKQRATGQGLRSETRKRVDWFDGDKMTSAGLSHLLRSVAFESIRLLKGPGSMLFFTDWRMVPLMAPAIESAGLKYQNMIVWRKPSVGLGHGFRPQHEIILHFAAGAAKYHDKSTGNVIGEKRINPQTRQHPTQKPVELLQTLLRVVCPEGGTVFDPFGGAGSTAVAAEGIGRSALIVERSPEHCATARARLGNVQLSIFDS